ALVEGAAEDHAFDALALDGAQLVDVGNVGHAPGGDHRHDELARQPHRGLDVDSGQHAVAADVGVDDALDAVILELASEVEYVVAGQLAPAVGCDLAFAGIEPDQDAPRERAAGVVEQAWIADGRGPDDQVREAIVEIALHRIEVADPAAELHRDVVADRIDDGADHALVLWPAAHRAVEIDEV